MKHLPIVPLVATGSHLKQGLPMRKILSLCLAVILMTGCESDFDKCMRTELPRAVTDSGLDEARGVLLQFEAASLTADYLTLAEEARRKWASKNPKPSEPKAPSLSDFEQFDEWVQALGEYRTIPVIADWLSTSDRMFFAAFILEGGDMTTLEDLQRWLEGVETLLKPRAKRNDCWGAKECKSPLLREYMYLRTNSDEELDYDAYSGNMIRAAISDSISWEKNRIAGLEKLAQETAIRACNANGFYE